MGADFNPTRPFITRKPYRTPWPTAHACNYFKYYCGFIFAVGRGLISRPHPLTTRQLTTRKRWGATPGIFFSCFCLFEVKKKKHLCSFWAEAVLFFVHIVAVGNTPYGKRHTSRTVFLATLQPILQESLFTAIVLVLLPKSIRRFLQPEKRLRDERYN